MSYVSRILSMVISTLSMENNRDQIVENKVTTADYNTDNSNVTAKDLMENSQQKKQDISMTDNEERFYDASSYTVSMQDDEEQDHQQERVTNETHNNSDGDDDRLIIADANSISTEESMFPDITMLNKKAEKVPKDDVSLAKHTTSNHFEVGFKTNHLRELLVMQLDLIGHQQFKILEKDKQIIALKSEKEQLEARLSRMERRISVQKKHTFELASEESFTLTRSKVMSPSLKSPVVTQATQKKLVENSAENKTVNLAPVTITSCNDKGFCFENFLRTNVAYLDPPFKRLLCNKKEATKTSYKVPVPPWRVIDQVPNMIIDEETAIEDTSDLAYDKRHSKPEQEEKRRKRWDLQQARQQRQHEMLVQRYIERQKKGNGQGKSGDFASASKQSKQTLTTIDSLSKGSDGIYAVDVTEIVPVCAFGYPLPSLAPRELDIPWFNIAKREVQLRTAKQKQVTRSKRKVRSSVITQRRRCRNNVK